MEFVAKTWNNGHYHASGAGYGLRITFQDREQFFDRNWQRVILHLDGYSSPIEVNVAKESFWNRDCGELIKNDIGIWLQLNNCERWPFGQPHEVRMTKAGHREFKVELIN